MSVSGAINFHINRNSRSITAVELIGFFEAGGWGLPFLGKICYLPLGDDDLFDWTYVPANEEHRELVLSIVEQKEEAGELIGINLGYQNGEEGIMVLMYPGLTTIMVENGLNRKTIADWNVSDFSWYLAQVVPILVEAGLSIEFFECKES